MSFDLNINLSYPTAKRTNQSDNYHGTIVADPYRYMEDPADPDTKKFVEDNNTLYEHFIDKKMLEKYRTTFHKYLSFTTYSVPTPHNEYYYFTKNEGKDPQGKLYRQNKHSSEVVELFDFNTLSDDGTTSPLVIEVSPDDKLVALVVSKHGSDWHHLLIINVETKEILETIDWVNFTEVLWQPDSSGFFYSGFPNQTGLPLEKQRRGEKLFYHVLGSPVADDKLIFDPQDELFGVNFRGSSDGQWLTITSNKSTMPQNKVFFINTQSLDTIITIIPELDGFSYRIVDIVDGEAFCLTSWNAPNKKIMKFSVTNPQKDKWTELVPEKKHVLEGVSLVNNQLLLAYIEDVKHEVYIYSLHGELLSSVELPDIGSLTKDNNKMPHIGGRTTDKEFFFSFENFFTPPTIYKYDFPTKQISTFFGETLAIDKSKFVIKQVFYDSKDGTKIPMFIMHKNNIVLNGSHKTILHGYGGYNISKYPEYLPRYLSWLENGGVYAVANLRGGGEYGKKWHFQGILGNKQNVFDDFIAAAEYLIAQKYTTTKKLAINGRSNGGLLVGACMTQRPDLFGVCVPEVGVLDMLRFKHFQAGRYWTAEYGDAELNADHFDFLIKYSPLHNTDKHTRYPPTLAVSAESDDRVVPMHTKKFTAALQHTQKARNPVLMRIETKAGHGYGKSQIGRAHV